MCCIFKNYHAFKYKNKRWGTVRNYNGNGKNHNLNSRVKIAFLSRDRSVPILSNTVLLAPLGVLKRSASIQRP